MAKNNNTIYWIIGIIILFLVVSPSVNFKDIFSTVSYSPDNENLIYQTHENIKIIEDGCIIEQRNSVSTSTTISCATWLNKEKFEGNIDFSVYQAPFFWNRYGTELKWVYEFGPGVSGCSIKSYGGGLYTYFTGVRLDGGQLVREISELYSYEDYNFSLPIKQSYIENINPVWIMNGYCQLGVSTNEEGIEIIDDCGDFGVIDPNPYNGINELKCDAYCKVGERECTERADGLNESQVCVDGSVIDHTICYRGCSNGLCTVKPTMDISLIGDHHYGDDVKVIVRLLLGEDPYGPALIVGRIEVEGASISETLNYTDENGYTTLNFEKVEAGGIATFVASVIIRGVETQETTEIYFSGVPILFELTTESYIQSNAGNITFLVEVTDNKYKPIHEELVTDLRVETALSAGTVLKDYIEYMGAGVYEVRSEVTGTGVFSGRLLFNYQGEAFESPSINIDVDYATISIGTNLIDPIATLDTEETYVVVFTSSLGTLIDPDDIEIRISLPTGYEEDVLTMNDLRKISEGTYEFDYYFSQVEKYSFDVYADKEGFARGHARATVSVAEEGAGFIGFGDLSLIFYAVIGLIILFIIIGKRRKGA